MTFLCSKDNILNVSAVFVYPIVKNFEATPLTFIEWTTFFSSFYF